MAGEARIPRGVARAVVKAGLLDVGPYSEIDIVLMRVAAACLALPSDAHPYAIRKRNKDAVRFARAIAASPSRPVTAAVLVGSQQAWAADTDEDTRDGLLALYPDPVLVLPVGGWLLNLPSRRPESQAALTSR